MLLLVLGLVLFLGIHSAKMLFPQVRIQLINKVTENGWKGIYSLISVAGFVLIVIGYGQARYEPLWLWYPPIWLNHVTTTLVFFTFILLAASRVPGNRIKAKVKHPMLIAVKVWAFAHLLSNPTLADVILFGSFLVWSVSLFRTLKKQPAEMDEPAPDWRRDALTLLIGVLTFGCFGAFFHPKLIGVSPFVFS